MSQIWRWLALAGGHEQTLGAEIIKLLADKGICGGSCTILLNMDRILGGIAPIVLQHCPRPREGVVNQRDLVVQERRIGLVEEDALSDDRLVVGMGRQAGRVQGTGPFEVAGLDVEHVEAAVAVLIKPLANRITLKARL